MKIGGMGEQAIRVQHYELRRLNELPEEVEILAVLPELPPPCEVVYVDGGRGPRPVLVHDQMQSPPLPAGWVPHPRAEEVEPRCLYIHVKHRYCFRGSMRGAALTIECLDDFLKRFADIRRQEELWKDEKVADHFPADLGSSWVDNDTVVEGY